MYFLPVDHPKRQREVCESVASQIAAGKRTIAGVMMESFLVEGRQDHDAATPLVYGQSITDACLSWDDTSPLLDRLGEAIRAKRSA